MKNELELSKEIYSFDNIIQTCEIYKEYAQIKVKSKIDKVVLTFTHCKYACDITMKEFENYLINMENM